LVAIPRLRERGKESIEVPALYEEDIEEVSRRLGLHDKLVKGELRCFICGKPVNLENLGAFLRTGDGIKVVCSDPPCILKAVEIAKIYRTSKTPHSP